MVCIAGVLGTKQVALWGRSRSRPGIFAFLILVVMSSAVAELYGRDMANRLVLLGFMPLIVSMLLIQFVLHVVPPARHVWHEQDGVPDHPGPELADDARRASSPTACRRRSTSTSSRKLTREDGQRAVAARADRQRPVADRRHLALHHHRLLRRRRRSASSCSARCSPRWCCRWCMVPPLIYRLRRARPPARRARMKLQAPRRPARCSPPRPPARSAPAPRRRA